MKKRLISVLGIVGVLAAAVSLVVPRVLPSALSFYRPDILLAVPTKDKKVFITIDDAPSKNTGEILSVLTKHGVPASFFIISDRVSTPTQLEEIIQARHSLGNHLQTTKACSKLSQSEFETSFDHCAGLLQASTKPRFFRPASDFGTRQQIAYARAKGYEAVMGTIFPMDHWISDPDWLVHLSSWLTVRGGILILHDGATGGQTSAVVLDRLIPKLKSAGFTFGRLEEAGANPSLHRRAQAAADYPERRASL
jgi:peptidoglycan/xylan/chitin deacetylase (PgdA/CDA1 family)